jgi:hypothetical protein
MSAKKKGETRRGFKRLRPLDWLLSAVPLAFFVHFVPAWKNETLAGGMRFPHQRFNQTATRIGAMSLRPCRGRADHSDDFSRSD